ncbi:hypothetical protein ACF0H5_002732 [Mactra antiquata]
MGQPQSVFDAKGNIRIYPFPYAITHKLRQTPYNFFMRKCFLHRTIVFTWLVGAVAFARLQVALRTKKNKESWVKTRAHYDHRFFRPPHEHMPNLSC